MSQYRGLLMAWLDLASYLLHARAKHISEGARGAGVAYTRLRNNLARVVSLLGRAAYYAMAAPFQLALLLVWLVMLGEGRPRAMVASWWRDYSERIRGG